LGETCVPRAPAGTGPRLLRGLRLVPTAVLIEAAMFSARRRIPHARAHASCYIRMGESDFSERLADTPDTSSSGSSSKASNLLTGVDKYKALTFRRIRRYLESDLFRGVGILNTLDYSRVQVANATKFDVMASPITPTP
jgi:hypothetical protein